MATKALSKAAKAKAQAKSAALNAKYRAEAAQLKRAGVLSDKVNARKNISRATRTKINKFRDVLEGKTTVVKAPKQVREKYADVLDQRGSFLLVPKERAKERTKIRKGLVEVERLIDVRGVPVGEEREVILPFKLTDMPALAERLQTDESLNGLKRGDEMFAFRLDGWASKQPFVDAEEMGDYISRNYAHLFKPGSSRKAVKYLTFLRYKPYANPDPSKHRPPEGEHTGRLKMPKKKKPAKWIEQNKRDKAATRQAKVRAAESDTARKDRLAKQRIRSAQNRQRKFDGD